MLFRAFTKHPFNYPSQLRQGNRRGLYHSYMLRKKHAFRVPSVAEQKTQSRLEKNQGLLFDDKCSKDSSLFIVHWIQFLEKHLRNWCREWSGNVLKWKRKIKSKENVNQTPSSCLSEKYFHIFHSTYLAATWKCSLNEYMDSRMYYPVWEMNFPLAPASSSWKDHLGIK